MNNPGYMRTFPGVWGLIEKDVEAGIDPVVAGFTKLLKAGIFSVGRSDTHGVRAGFIALMQEHGITLRFSTRQNFFTRLDRVLFGDH